MARWWDYETGNDASQGKPDWRDAYNWLWRNLKEDRIQAFKQEHPWDTIPYSEIDSNARNDAERIINRAIKTYNYKQKEQ